MLKERAENYFKKLLSSVMKQPVHRIEADSPLELYGIDSIMAMQMTNQLEKTFGSLPKTLFFEYQSLGELTDYFFEFHQPRLMEYLGGEEGTEPAAPNRIEHEPKKKPTPQRSWKRGRHRFAKSLDSCARAEDVSDVAIIGLSGRYPKASSLDEFWENLQNGKDCISEIPEERWDHTLYFNENKDVPGKVYSKWGGFIDGVDEFDPRFFSISPREAEIMEPQERLFLQCAYNVLEDAGYTRENITPEQKGACERNVGVYVGVMYEEYQLYGAQEQAAGKPVALSGTPASIANRVSYFCNFNGPSMAIDTMCSSSLTAIYLAVQDLRRGVCKAAIVGGVNVSVHPNKYLLLSQGKFVSSKGWCESFGLGGDGYVPGEGVGAVLLKPLSKAVADGDHIYGVIKGIAINHGGKTNGYSVPNPRAQASVIQQAVQEAGINHTAISYIEAHGTGTSLGDPIEIAGLTRAFGENTSETGFCSLGSVKSNIGHCESAAGIAGLTKVLLQMQHGKLVPSLHSETLNPNIDFSSTPFVVQQDCTEWHRPQVQKNGTSGEGARIAGISTFGAGGSNAHMVVEEYLQDDIAQPNHSSASRCPAIIILSARNKTRLLEMADRLLTAVRSHRINDTRLEAAAYTLQVGREAMEERLAFMVSSVRELEDILTSYLEGREDIDGLHQGQVGHYKKTLSVFAADEDMAKTIEAWVDKGKYHKLLSLWVKGLTVDWGKLHNSPPPGRVSLPTYPFAKGRYWLPKSESPSVQDKNAPARGSAILHPLLHENISNFSTQRFSSTFSGQEPFLADRIVHGKLTLPPTAFLEMARAAVNLAMGADKESSAGMRMTNITWAQPLTLDDCPTKIDIALFPGETGDIEYEIYRNFGETDNESVVLCYGSVRPALPSEESYSVDLNALRNECSINILGPDDCHDSCRLAGLDYGPGFQSIKSLHLGTDRALIQVSWPSTLKYPQEQFVLQSCLLDPAIHTLAGSMTGRPSTSFRPMQPLALQKLEILKPCPSTMWGVIQPSGNKTSKLNIDWCDESGAVCIRMKGLETMELLEAERFREPEAAVPASNTSQEAQEEFEMMTFEEIWSEQQQPVPSPATIKTMICFISEAGNRKAVIEAAQELGQSTQVVFISQGAAYKKKSKQSYSIARSDSDTYTKAFEVIRKDYGEVDAILYMWPHEDPDCRRDYSCIVSILHGISAGKIQPGRILLAAQFQEAVDLCYLESWIGFERSLGFVMPKTKMATVCLDAGGDNPETEIKDWLATLFGELRAETFRSAFYFGGKRHVRTVLTPSLELGDSRLRPGGTCLITGGCGGLGLLFAEYLAEKSTMNLILTGRSSLNEEKNKKIKKLETLGSEVHYIQADVGDLLAMQEGLNVARDRFGAIHGVLHTAGLRDSRNILEKEAGDFLKIVDPKIKGTLVIDELLTEDHLDFVCYFSSSAAILGDFGSCDYAVGNRFQMAHAAYRNNLQQQEKRHGKTFVINWPLWREGGMGASGDESVELYLKSSGQRLLESEEGLAVFEIILAQNKTQHLVLCGQRSRAERFLGLAGDTGAVPTTHVSIPSEVTKGRRVEMKGLTVEQCLEWDLKEYAGQILKISRDQMDADENLADFGFDSVSLSEFAAELTARFGVDVSPALFFSHSTIESLTAYLFREFPEIIQSLYKEEVVEQAELPMISAEPAKTVMKRRPSLRCKFSARKVGQANSLEPIAIIGMSGRFPEARNIQEMWDVLANGRNVVKEIPEDRFDWRKYYSGSTPAPGKTNSKWCGCIPGVAEFDPLFFEIAPRDAENMDPRQRLLLQESWKALEDAGYGPRQIQKNRIGVFVGVEQGDYRLLVDEENHLTSNHNAILASRLAYFLNLNGPVIAINTACSSGLVCAHQACLSLRANECDTAIAAAANLILTPQPYIAVSQAGMLSPDGKCFAFDQRANGMVPGEAVAAVVLKKLSMAERDGDPIYAVIKGSGINYDGKTNGITAPSGTAQTNLLKSVYDQYSIDPEDIEYIVTHGTGTQLGDPVEINALCDAFRGATKKREYCALTSSKTNFGHTFAASGLVSLISLVQAIRNRTIPASLHCKQENDYINWKESPFYVNKTQKSWTCDPAGKRRTGVLSAFGMSGTNAHMVVQEYSAEEGEQSLSRPPFFLLAFSAKTQVAMREKINNTVDFLQSGETQFLDLSRMSYTLLEGRFHFNHRCAVVVQGVDDAVYALQQLESGKQPPNVFQGKKERDFTSRKAVQQYADNLLRQSNSRQGDQTEYRENLSALAEFYCQGYELPWSALFDNSDVRCLRLPTYPFARNCYWADTTEAGYTGNSAAVHESGNTSIHPLLQRNTSDLLVQRFSSTFTGKEFFLADHVVKGRSVLPGVAYLELTRAAIEQATRPLMEERGGIRLKNVVWTHPVAVDEGPANVHIALHPGDNGEIAYEITSESDAHDGDQTLHNQGKAELIPISVIPTLDINELRAQCTGPTITQDQCYEAFRGIGLDYGPGHRAIEQIFTAPGQVLAKLTLPHSVSSTLKQFFLHPGMMDSAQQAAIGLMLEQGGSLPLSKLPALKLALPFALEEIDIYAKCTSTMWALIRFSSGSGVDNRLQQIDIDLYNERGTICVKMKGFTSRVLDGEIDAEAAAKESQGVLMLEPCWRERPVDPDCQDGKYSKRVLILCEPKGVVVKELTFRLPGVDCLVIETGRKNIEERFQICTLQIFEKIKAILTEKPEEMVLIQTVFSCHGEQQLFHGLSGLMKTAEKESSKCITQLIAVESWEDAEGIMRKLEENSRCKFDNQLTYRDGKRYTLDWREIESPSEEAGTVWKEGGVYLITGGAGGLGRVFAREIGQHIKKGTLILVGRAKLDKDKQNFLDTSVETNLRIEYRQVDVTQKKEVNTFIKSINQDFGGLNGIIHAAGVLDDNFIAKQTEQKLLKSMEPKVSGLMYLDWACKNFKLDFFIVFSSIAGSLGNAGQAGYAAANAFMDSFAGYRNQLVAANKRHGRTLSINWPLWKDGGMQVDPQTEKMMLLSMGMVPLQIQDGVRAFYRGLASDREQVMVMAGGVNRIKKKLMSMLSPNALQKNEGSSSSGQKSALDTTGLQDKVLAALMREVSQLLKVDIGDIDAESELSEYGFDSISFVEFGNRLNQKYQLELTPTVFFEHSTLACIAEYLAGEHQITLAPRFAASTADEQLQSAQPDSNDKPKTVESGPKKRGLRFAAGTIVRSTANNENDTQEPIAIVGMSCRFPKARDVNQFWSNLVDGKDCISEIPKERWDWREYWGDPDKEINKTNVKWGGFIEGVDEFDPLFFGISPREAEFMDPQQRLLMLYAWKAIEDAGYSAQRLSGSKTGIFVGTSGSGYSKLIMESNVPIEGYSSTGIVPSVGPNRMSYFLNIHGPSEPVETACSSSLVAIHRATQAIQSGTCEMAIVGGVNTLIIPEPHISFSKAGMLCEDGRCKTFSNQANGYVRGEGVGMLFLRKLQDAKRSGDHIYGVIRGTAENHGGRANSLTAPNPKAQAELLRTAYSSAGIDPRTVSYIEAHGTGTELGDPIEIDGLRTAFKELYQSTGETQVRDAHCGLGSVKSNIGHLELAAGIAGVVKVLLQLKHKTLVKSLHCDTINPYIRLENSPFYIVQNTSDWVAQRDSRGQDLPRRAGVSSFGFGGANAHIILEEYIPASPASAPADVSRRNPAIIILSARNEVALHEQAKRLLVEIQGQNISNAYLYDMAFTLQVGREAMEERLAIMTGTVDDLARKLQQFLDAAEGIEDLYRGAIGRHRETISAFSSDEDLGMAIDAWIAKGKFVKLLGLWVKGFNLDWNKLYGEGELPRLMSLPTYPFARERYWLASEKPQLAAKSVVKSPRLEQTDNEQSWLEVLSDHEPEKRRELLHSFILKNLSGLLKLNSTQIIDSRQPLVNMGLDSLMAMALRKQVESQLDLDLAGMQLLGGESLDDLVNLILQDMAVKEDGVDFSPSVSEATINAGVQDGVFIEGAL